MRTCTGYCSTRCRQADGASGGERPTAELPETSVADAADQVAVGAAVRAALKRLPEQQRTVLVLRYFADLTDRQTAKALGIPVGTVKSRLSRALTELSNDDHLADLPGNRSTP